MLKKRAQTPQGQAILKRLRYLLNGSDGESLPEARRSPDAPYGDKSQPIEQPDGALSFSTVAGFGFLHILTGDKKYADLSKQAMQLVLDGYRDRDGKARYLDDMPLVLRYLERTAARYRDLEPLARLLDGLHGRAPRVAQTF